MNNPSLLQKDLLTLLSCHIFNNASEKYYRYKKFLLSLFQNSGLSFSPDEILFYGNQNINAPVAVIIDPFYLSEAFRQDDEIQVRVLFKKILESVNINNSNAYFTYTFKGHGYNGNEENSQLHKYILQEELNLIQPQYILGFGRYVSEFLSDSRKELNNLEISTWNNLPVFLGSHPADAYYDPAVKKPLWNLLKMFQQNCNYVC